MVNYDDAKNYRKCHKKLYDIYACIPPKGTIVINKLEQADVVKQFRGKTYFTVKELDEMRKKGDNTYNVLVQLCQGGMAYATNENTPVVLAGTLGEMWCVNMQKLASAYMFLNNGQPVRITEQSLSHAMSDKNIMDWKPIRTVPDNSQAWACFVPSSQKGQLATSWGAILNINGIGVQHGKGDFVIAADGGGTT